MSSQWNGTDVCLVMWWILLLPKPSQTLRGCQVVARAKMPKLCASQVVRAFLAYSGLFAEASTWMKQSRKMKVPTIPPIKLILLHVHSYAGCFDPAFTIKLSQIINMSFSFPYLKILIVEKLHTEVEGFHVVPGGVHQAVRGKDDHCGAINRRFIVGNEQCSKNLWKFEPLIQDSPKCFSD